MKYPLFHPISRAVKAIICFTILLCFSGCRSVKVSDPPRTLVEQLLLSTAADDAMAEVDLSWLKGKKVFVEEKYFEGYDKGYAIGLIRQRLSDHGALLMKGDDKADYIVEIRNGALGVNTKETLVGIPSMGVPVPLAGPLQTPELAFYKSQRFQSGAKFALFAYERVSGEYLQTTGNVSGKARYHLYKVLFVSWQRTDIPEMQKSKTKSSQPKK